MDITSNAQKRSIVGMPRNSRRFSVARLTARPLRSHVGHGKQKMKLNRRNIVRRVSSLLRGFTPQSPVSTITRDGWPPISSTPELRRRSTDASPWLPHGPRDDWKR